VAAPDRVVRSEYDASVSGHTPWREIKHKSERVQLAELVTAAEIGRRLGLTRQRVQQLANEAGFPEPLGRVGHYIVYRWRDIEAWAQSNGRPVQSPVPAPGTDQARAPNGR
jgi:hypothetical protein